MAIYGKLWQEIFCSAWVEDNKFSLLIVKLHFILLGFDFCFLKLFEHTAVLHWEDMPCPGMVVVRLGSILYRHFHQLLWQIYCFCQSHVIDILQVNFVGSLHISFASY